VSEKQRGFFGKIMDYLADRVLPEMGETIKQAGDKAAEAVKREEGKTLQDRVVEHARDDVGVRDVPANGWTGYEPPKQGIGGKIADHMMDRLLPEVGDMLMQKAAQGSAEISAALNHQSTAYQPYGYAQKPLEVEGPQTSYMDLLRQAAERQGPEHDRGIDR
jgi:hypothetical protein